MTTCQHRQQFINGLVVKADDEGSEMARIPISQFLQIIHYFFRIQMKREGEKVRGITQLFLPPSRSSGPDRT